MLEFVKVWEHATMVVFASVGGLLGYMFRSISNNTRPTLKRGVLESTSSAFVGALAILVCQAFDLGTTWTGVVVGVSGWLGAEASILIVTKTVRNKLGLDQSGDV